MGLHHHGHRHDGDHSQRPAPGGGPGAQRSSVQRLSEHQDGDSRKSHALAPDKSSSRALLWAVGLTAAFAVVELAGGLWSGSLALLADFGHMATDSAALLFSLAANVVAQRPVSERHSFGLARAEVIAAFVNSLALLAVIAWLVVEGVHRVLEPHAVNGAAVAGIASVGLCVNLAVAWVLSRDRSNLNVRAALLHVLGDLLGSVAALVAGIVIVLTGFMTIDPLLSMLVSGLILRSTIGVLRESTLVLLDSVPADVDFENVGQALARVRGVRSVHDLHVWSMVPGHHAVSAHLLIESIERWPQILKDARNLLAHDFGIDHVTLQPEWLHARRPAASIALRKTT